MTNIALKTIFLHLNLLLREKNITKISHAHFPIQIHFAALRVGSLTVLCVWGQLINYARVKD